jgi:ABC-type transport system substrate-binding protein
VCLAQEPNISLGVNGYMPDQCAEIPTIANGDEAADGVATTLKVDPTAQWSDGTPVTGQDFCFGADPQVNGATPYDRIKSCQATYATFTITWQGAYSAYLDSVAHLTPFPLHIYQAQFGGATYAYRSGAAQQLINRTGFLTRFPVTNGAYTVQRFKTGDSITLVKNPKCYSGFVKEPNADQIVFKGMSSNTCATASIYSGAGRSRRGFPHR